MPQSPIYLDINNNKSVITALKAGEEKVFDVVYRHYFRRLCAFCSQYVSEQEEIEEQLFRIEQYVSMALQYQRKDSHDYVLHSIALDGIIRDSIHKYAKMMIRKKIGIQYEGCDLVVTSDEKWLSFVVEQLLSNAVKYMQEGVITIQTGQNETEAFLCIEDQGIGIRQEDIPRVFEQGYTGFNGHTDKHLYLIQI